MVISNSASKLSALRKNLDKVYRMDESDCVKQRLEQASLPQDRLGQIEITATELVMQVRKQRLSKSGLDAFLHEYDLSSEEGIALMCLAEALLRVPDEETVHELIKDKITAADWQAHVGESDSMFVNAATWGLMLTGKILGGVEQKKLTSSLQKFLQRSSKPVIHNAVRQAMKILGQQFVMGKTIADALKRSQKYSDK